LWSFPLANGKLSFDDIVCLSRRHDLPPFGGCFGFDALTIEFCNELFVGVAHLDRKLAGSLKVLQMVTGERMSQAVGRPVRDPGTFPVTFQSGAQIEGTNLSCTAAIRREPGSQAWPDLHVTAGGGLALAPGHFH